MPGIPDCMKMPAVGHPWAGCEAAWHYLVPAWGHPEPVQMYPDLAHPPWTSLVIRGQRSSNRAPDTPSCWVVEVMEWLSFQAKRAGLMRRPVKRRDRACTDGLQPLSGRLFWACA